MKIPYDGNLQWIHDRTILLVRHGSHAYGLAHEHSDVDLKGVAIPPREYFLGFLQDFAQVETREPYDMVIYEITKFFKLASNCNPNIIEVLWTDEEDHRIVTPAGQKLLEHRKDFLSRKARHTFSGYAMSQLKRIKTHRRWLLAAPTAPPTREEYGLPERTVIPKDQLAAAESRIRKQVEVWEPDMSNLSPVDRLEMEISWSKILAEMSINDDSKWQAAARAVGYDANFLDLLDRERRYRSKMQDWRQYNQWKNNRNPARAALEAKYGYDSKHASHLVRLMRMCREILETGEVVVKRPDREDILAIRRGAWSYEQLIEWAEAQDKELDAFYKSSPLPKSPDRGKLDALCIELVEEALRS